MLLIVGLGNPGKEYASSRHNLGFMVVDEIAGRLEVDIRRKGFKSFYSEANFGRKKLLLLKPSTFMNKSGEAVSEAANYYKIASKDIIVVQDELDLRRGGLQVKEGGGSAGHKGVDSMIKSLGKSDFIRVRVGIGKPVDRISGINHVLGGFSPEEEELIGGIVQLAADAVLEIIRNGVESAMNKYNRRAHGQVHGDPVSQK